MSGELTVRASDDDRRTTVDMLRRASVAGCLTIEEYDGRVAAAWAATTRGDLAQLVRDLPQSIVASSAAPELAEPVLAGELIQADNSGRLDTRLVMLSSTRMTGPWRVPSRMRVRAVLGSTVLDLREARLPEGGVVLDLRAFLGSIDVIVAEGMDVDVAGGGFLGSCDVRIKTPPQPGGPRISIRANGTLGSVTVRDRASLSERITDEIHQGFDDLLDRPR